MTDQSSQWPGWDPASQPAPQPAPQPVQDSADDQTQGLTQQQAQPQSEAPAGPQAAPQAEQQAWYRAQEAAQYRTQDPNQYQPQDPGQAQYQPQAPYQGQAQYQPQAPYQGQAQYQPQAPYQGQAQYQPQDQAQYQDQGQYRPQAPMQYPAHGQAVQGRYYPPTGLPPAMRAGSADRERTIDVLRAGFAEGRLTQDEYNDRMNRTYEARTYGELHAVVADLPVGPVPAVVPPMWQPAPVTRTNSLATASMVLGIAEFATMGVTALPAVICGHIARRQMRQTSEQGSGMAITGLVLGYLGILFWVALFAGLTIAVSGHGGGSSPAFPQQGP
jgi:Domain of unknown function (DUF1707)/Domain of unknown function (DUF4190)